MPCSCCGCGRCVVNGQVNHDYRTQAECERCRVCVEAIETECDGDCPPETAAMPPLVTLGFSSEDCGTGGSGSVVIGCGQILSATVTNGGSGYATETISEPTLTATAPGGTGGVLSINGYAKIVGGLFDGYYVPTGITVTSGGSGYTDNAQVTLSLGTNDEWAPGSGAPNIRIRTTSAIRPPVDQWILAPGATAPTGTGLVISMTFSTTPEFDSLSGLWIFRAQSVSVVNGGSGYAVGQTVGPRAFEGNPASTVGRAVVRITQVDAAGSVLSVAFGTGVLARGRYRVDAGAPVDQWTLTPYSSNGSGLVVSLTLAIVDFGEEGYAPGYGPIYGATAATVVNGGTGYGVGTEIDVAGSTTVEGNPTVVVVSSVDGSGAVTGLDVLFGGYHEGTDTGVISSVVITSNRPARKRTVEACEVAVSIVQESPSAGTGATITATVETNSGENFGKVTGLTVAHGGSGYVALCEKKTTVASCDECSPRESPESAICEDNGGCPCGTWVFDSNQEPCACCYWQAHQAIGYCAADGYDSQSLCAELEQDFQSIAQHFRDAGWTVTVEEWDESTPYQPGCELTCGWVLRAECMECERVYPRPFSRDSNASLSGDSAYAAPCDPSQWHAAPRASLGSFEAYPPAVGCFPLGTLYANPGAGGVTLIPAYWSWQGDAFSTWPADTVVYIPKCGQRISECVCCIPVGQTGEPLNRSCCSECPAGYTCYPGACGNPLP